MEKMILSFDSQNLNAIQACPRKAQLQFIENLQPQTKAPALEKGSLLHNVMEIADGLIGNCANFESDTWIALSEAGLFNLSSSNDLTQGIREEKVNFALEAGKFFASKLAIDSETASSVLYQAKEYYEFYKSDPWSTLCVEEVATRIIYETDEVQVLYSGKIDRVVEQGMIHAPMDHKSSERRQDPSSLSNQFIGYCWLLGMNHIIIDKIGFQKTLKPVERFQRYILTIDDQRIKEWEENTIWWIKSYWENHLKTGHFPMNLTSCDKYGSCTYSSICESNPEGREWKKERDFIIGEVWDVASVLEGSK
jgi:hypothetical protein